MRAGADCNKSNGRPMPALFLYFGAAAPKSPAQRFGCADVDPTVEAFLIHVISTGLLIRGVTLSLHRNSRLNLAIAVGCRDCGSVAS